MKAHFKNSVLPSLFVAVVVAIMAIYAYGLGSTVKWKAPPNYGWGDSDWMLNLLDSAATGDLQPFRPFIREELAAPYSANYSDWPMGLTIEIQPGGWLIKLFGLAVGANLYLILCHVAAGLSMFLSLRFMKCSALWATVCAIAFGLCPYLFYRNFAHITLVNTAYLIPIICAAIWHFLTNSPEHMGKREFFFVILLSFLMGTQSPYYSAPYLWALFAAGVFWWINLKKFKPVFLYGSAIAIFAGGFLLGFAPALIHSLAEGKNFLAVNRAYANLQVVALRPIEMFLPGSESGIPILKQLSAFYENQCIFRKSFEHCESMAAYLGLVGCLGFLLLIGIAIYFILSRQQNKIPGWFWFALFLIAFSVVGGLNGFLGLGKFYFLRGTNRYSIYILAISLIFLAVFLSSNSLLSRKWIRWGVAAFLLLLACAEPLLPNLLGAKLPISGFGKIESDKKFAVDLEKSLPERSMVFNYPVIELPERGTYAYFRPTFFTDKIRYSFGALTGRARETWQLDVEKLPLNQMIEQLSEYGFSGILIYKGEDLSDEQKVAAHQAADFFNQNNYSSISSPAGDFEFFAFNPNPNPVFPAVRPMYVNNWWSTQIQPAGFTNDSGGEESGWRWSTHASARVEAFNEQPVPRRLILRGRAIGTTESGLQIFIKQKMVFSGKIPSDRSIEFSTNPIEVGGHKAVRFELKSDQKPVVREGRKFSFAVSELEAMWE